jgi:hypothetical protein
MLEDHLGVAPAMSEKLLLVSANQQDHIAARIEA